MSYLALYRKYRSVDFTDFAGQTEIAESLRYQVKTGTFGHSYLFHGIRGTGKTSMAKVFSKAINCLDPQEGNPCGQCASCKAFQEGGLIDVIEIDAASNNGVDDIRELRENSRFVPAYSQYKVYIIDEVQMLSKEAFNALLKTLEEPSPQVVFILATTELHKIPDTILSRTQRYTFRRIDQSDMVERMAMIARREGVRAEREGLQIIAEHAGGSMRDALSLMDKSLGLSQGILTEDSVRQSLGLLGRDKIDQIISSVFQGDLDNLIRDIDLIMKEGKEVGSVMEELMAFLRSLLLSKFVRNDDSLMNILNYSMAKYMGSYESIDPEALTEAIRVLEEANRRLRFTTMPRLALEMALIEIATKNTTIKTEIVKRRMEDKTIRIVEEDVPPPLHIKDDDQKTYWEKVLRKIKEGSDLTLYYLLAEASFEAIEGDELIISFAPEDQFSRNSVRQDGASQSIAKALEEVFLRPMNLVVREPEVAKNDDMELLRAFMGDAFDKLEIK